MDEIILNEVDKFLKSKSSPSVFEIQGFINSLRKVYNGVNDSEVFDYIASRTTKADGSFDEDLKKRIELLRGMLKDVQPVPVNQKSVPVENPLTSLDKLNEEEKALLMKRLRIKPLPAKAEVKPEAIQPAAVRPIESTTPEIKPEAPKPAVVKPVEAPKPEMQPEVPKPAVVKPVEAPKPEMQPEAPKTAVVKPVEVLKPEMQPEAPKPAIAKPVEAPKPEMIHEAPEDTVVKPVEAFMSEKQSEASKPAVVKPVEVLKPEMIPEAAKPVIKPPLEVGNKAGTTPGTSSQELMSRIEALKMSSAKDGQDAPIPEKHAEAAKPAGAAGGDLVKSRLETLKKAGAKEDQDKQAAPAALTKEQILRRLEASKTATVELIDTKLTPEKKAVANLLEEKLVSDVESRIRKLREQQKWMFEEKKPRGPVEKVKTFFQKNEVEIELYNPDIHGPLVTFDGMEKYNEIERYWVNEPYAFVVVLHNPERNDYIYYVAEPKLSRFEDTFLSEIKERLKDVLMVENIVKSDDKEKVLADKVRALVKDYAIELTPPMLEKIMYYTKRDFINLGKLDALMNDDTIEDISANGHDKPIYLYHKKYQNIPTNVVFTEEELNSFIIRLAQRAGKHISIAEPLVDATMPDGSRIQMTLGTEVTAHGGTFTIRKFSEVPMTPIDLIKWKTFSAESMAYLWLCIENNKSLIFAGGTASGKTSSLNAVSLFIPPKAKVISLEDTRELKLPHPNWIPAVTRDSFTADERGAIDMYELLRAALRQRPEYLLVGEVRGKEALTLFQAMSTGHTTFSTMHADSVASAIHRLENPPISVPRTMIQALNIISIQAQTYVKGKRVRRNLKLVEITDIDPNTRNIRTNDIFAWDSMTDLFSRVGESKSLHEIQIRRGWGVADLRRELANRQKVLEFMVNNDITDFNAISTIIHEYQVTPDKVLKKLKIE